jgi:hypothetical protein
MLSLLLLVLGDPDSVPVGAGDRIVIVRVHDSQGVPSWAEVERRLSQELQVAGFRVSIQEMPTPSDFLRFLETFPPASDVVSVVSVLRRPGVSQVIIVAGDSTTSKTVIRTLDTSGFDTRSVVTEVALQVFELVRAILLEVRLTPLSAAPRSNQIAKSVDRSRSKVIEPPATIRLRILPGATFNTWGNEVLPLVEVGADFRLWNLLWLEGDLMVSYPIKVADSEASGEVGFVAAGVQLGIQFDLGRGWSVAVGAGPGIIGWWSDGRTYASIDRHRGFKAVGTIDLRTRLSWNITGIFSLCLQGFATSLLWNVPVEFGDVNVVSFGPLLAGFSIGASVDW